MQVPWSIALDASCELTERPVWDDYDQSLVWVDIPGGDVHRLQADHTDTSVHIGAPLGVAGLRADGGLILASDPDIVFVDAAGHRDRESINAGLSPDVRFNDGACDPFGRFVVGTCSLRGQREQGHLLSVEPDGEIQVLLDRVTESNGVCWSPTGEIVYYVDSGEPAIREYDYDPATGTLHNRRDLVVIDEADGEPDGLAIDATGAIWVALWKGSAVRRYSPHGELLAHLELPVSRPTCPGFGGEQLDRLYVTTAQEGMTAAELAGEPWAGHILVANPGVSGAASHRFAG